MDGCVPVHDYDPLEQSYSLRAPDKQKWWCAKMLLGCAYFHDLLRPLSILCYVLQADEMCRKWNKVNFENR